MKKFIEKTLIISIVFFAICEIFSRLIVDPMYFDSIKAYDERKEKSYKVIFENNDTKHADFIFVGSSRIPATINPQLFKTLSKGVTINAGRGYMTPGIHYQAIKNKLKIYPNYLKNSIVLIEYEGSSIYTSSFEKDRLRVYEPVVKTDNPMPHLLLPHLDMSSFFSFLMYSKNSIGVKIEMTVLYFFSTYRAFQFINEKFNSYNRPLFKSKDSNLVSEGGIRDDKIEFAKQKAIIVANQNKEEIKNNPSLSAEIINKSSFAKLHEIIVSHGGTLMVYEMPLHSIQKDIYSSEKAQMNKVIFEKWLKEKGVAIIYNPDFKYIDIDFPDTWHLSATRRDEFTTKLYNQIKKNLPKKGMQ